LFDWNVVNEGAIPGKARRQRESGRIVVRVEEKRINESRPQRGKVTKSLVS
jgi:hypothetical protein